MKSFISSVLLGLLILAANLARAQERDDLVPPKARWWDYPADVSTVVVDRTGRPWCEVKGEASIDAVKQQVVAAAKSRAPWVRGASIVLFDSKHRIWLIPGANPQLLLGCDLETGQWWERPGLLPAERGGYDERNPKSARYVMTRPAFESKAGRLYFSDRLGVHVLDGDRWSHQHLYRENIANNLYHGEHQSFDEPAFAEDAQGNVRVWTPWGRFGWTGTLGFFNHDGREWRHVRLGGEPGARLRSLVPLANLQWLVCPDRGPAVLTEEELSVEEVQRAVQVDILRLGHADSTQRQAAQDRLRLMGGAALPAIRKALSLTDDPEVAVRLEEVADELAAAARSAPMIDQHTISDVQIIGRDPQDHILFWADRVQPPGNVRERRGGMWRLSPDGRVTSAPKGMPDWTPTSMRVDGKGRLWLARHDQGCVRMVDGEPFGITDSTETHFHTILGEDAEGRMFLSDGSSVVAVQPDFPETRTLLPTTIHPVPRGENVVCLDSTGHIWAQQPGGFLRRWQDGAWRDFDPPDGKTWSDDLTFLQPLHQGGLIAQKKPGESAVLFVDDAWRHYPNLRQLVQEQHGKLKTWINNRTPGRDFYAKLRVDAHGNVWVVEWDKCAVFDGERWTEVIRWPGTDGAPGNIDFCWPVNQGREMFILDNFRHRASFDRTLATAKWPPEGKIEGSDYTTRSGLWLDSRQRLWLPVSDSASAVMTEDRREDLPRTGFPRFEDSAGAIWFSNPERKLLVVLDASGRRVEFPEPTLHDTTAIVEDRPGSFWVGTTRGLLRLVKTDGAGGPALRVQTRYEHRVPKGSCLQMWVDCARNLWFYGPGPQDYRLYQVQLPE